MVANRVFLEGLWALGREASRDRGAVSGAAMQVEAQWLSTWHSLVVMLHSLFNFPTHISAPNAQALIDGALPALAQVAAVAPRAARMIAPRSVLDICSKCFDTSMLVGICVLVVNDNLAKGEAAVEWPAEGARALGCVLLEMLADIAGKGESYPPHQMLAALGEHYHNFFCAACPRADVLPSLPEGLKRRAMQWADDLSWSSSWSGEVRQDLRCGLGLATATAARRKAVVVVVVVVVAPPPPPQPD